MAKLTVGNRERRFIQCGHIGKGDKEIPQTHQIHLQGPGIRSKFKQRAKDLSRLTSRHGLSHRVIMAEATVSPRNTVKSLSRRQVLPLVPLSSPG